MTFTFNPDQETECDQLRAALGDTDEADAYLSDEQIEAALVAGYDQALVTLGMQMLQQMPNKITVVGLSVDMSGPIAALRSVIANAQARIDASSTRSSQLPIPSSTQRVRSTW